MNRAAKNVLRKLGTDMDLDEEREQLAARGKGFRFRLEVNHQYMSRWEELLGVHVADHGALPAGNESHRPRRIGRLSLG